MRRFALVFALVVGATPALAQPPPVTTVLGPAVRARSNDLGEAELDQERANLSDAVARALARSKAGFKNVHLVIQDIQPTRPTPAQLGASPGLSPMSVGLGGAAITGEVIAANGMSQPLRYRFFQWSLADQVDRSVWGDAEAAFDGLARELARGRVPNDARAWPAPHRSEALTGTRIPR